jgi:subtilase family serine protease
MPVFGLNSLMHTLSKAAALSLSALCLNSALAQSPAIPAASILARNSVSLGRQPATAPISGTVWLQLHNKATLDAAVKAMYTPGSPTFHQFATPDALKQFAPTEAEIQSVKNELAAHNLTVVSEDANHFSLTIKGQTSDFENAFNTTVNLTRTANGEVVHSLTAAPALRNAATGLVKAVSGISAEMMKPATAVPINPDTGHAFGMTPLASNPSGIFYSSNCFYAPQTQVYNTPGALTPAGAYSGLVYGASVTNTTPGTLAPCAYSPQDVYKLAGLTTAHQQGYTGKGQTIAIVDAYGSPTIAQDLATFNKIYGLPTSKFTSIQSSPFTATDAGWAGETTLDVEWSHAVAPDANILLVAAPSAYDNDLQGAILYIVENHLADVISNSYSGSEQSDIYYGSQGGYQDLTSWDELLEFAAFEGISANFASGDSGDLYAAEGVVDVPVPADSPYATGVGGTSAAFSPVDGSVMQTGWGTNITKLASKTTVLDPPLVEGFLYGAGGGTSEVFQLPAYQSSLMGTGRMMPDVSALADPYTGVEIIETVNGTTGYEAIGGTSLATPIFSAEWALLNQRAGASLGQAAPLIAAYSNTAAITDVVGLSTPYSVSGAILDSKGLTSYSASQLIAPETSTPFVGALYNSPTSGSHYDLSFGTDSSLPITPGWDPVTGWGTLNMDAIFSYLVTIK